MGRKLYKVSGSFGIYFHEDEPIGLLDPTTLWWSELIPILLKYLFYFMKSMGMTHYTYRFIYYFYDFGPNLKKEMHLNSSEKWRYWKEKAIKKIKIYTRKINKIIYFYVVPWKIIFHGGWNRLSVLKVDITMIELKFIR